jgi:5-methylcytosine-specific restriction endonuclease McrA
MMSKALCSACHRADCAGCKRRRSTAVYDRAWRALRLRHLADHPLCHDCQQQQRVEPATQVHHVIDVAIAPQRRLDPLNLMSLCHSCHSKRTASGVDLPPGTRPTLSAGAQIVGQSGFRGIA